MAEPFVFTPLRTRILRTVEVLGEPTTLDVAEKALTPTSETLNHLNALAEGGQIERRGRRWAVPTTEMVEPATVPYSDEDSHLEEDEDDNNLGCILALALFAFVIGTWMGACSAMP